MQKIKINVMTEFDKTSDLEINEFINNLKESYENYHRVTYGDGVIETIVNLSSRYITDRQFPDKAIDVMDELGSDKKINKKKDGDYYDEQ
jgi:ATP-dependent Clp protease ATP-binding subunit ClpC